MNKLYYIIYIYIYIYKLTMILGKDDVNKY